MSQQVFDKYWPLGNASAQEAIPGTAILQTRDDKDEPINLAGAMVWDAGSSLWVPVSENNPLPIALTGRVLAPIESLYVMTTEQTLAPEAFWAINLPAGVVAKFRTLRVGVRTTDSRNLSCSFRFYATGTTSPILVSRLVVPETSRQFHTFDTDVYGGGMSQIRVNNIDTQDVTISVIEVLGVW